MPNEHPKIFCIGLSRTGAKTLNDAIESLGFRSLFVLDFEHLEKNLSKYDAFTHTPVAPKYQELDRRFPNSKFILNTREKESWLHSVERQWTAKPSANIRKSVREVRQALYATDQFDRETFSRIYDEHLASVSRHFQGREHALLTLDVCGGEGFEKLCPFLGKPIPSQPFPHQNAAGNTSKQSPRGIKTFLIRYLKARTIKRFLQRLFRQS